VTIELANKGDGRETLKKEVRQNYIKVNIKRIIIPTESSIVISPTSVR